MIGEKVSSRLGKSGLFACLTSSLKVSRIAPSKRRFSGLPPDVATLVQQYVAKRQTSASLETLMRTGEGELLDMTENHLPRTSTLQIQEHQASQRILMQVASFVRREMPIRLAHRILDLATIPMMNEMRSVQEVKQVYIDSFLELSQYPKITSPEEEDMFAKRLEALYEKHSNVLIQMAKGAYELRKAVWEGQLGDGMVTKRGDAETLEFERMDECHAFLDRFYMSRIGIRVLAGQYLALRGEPLPDYVGMICKKTSPKELVEFAASDATLMCEREYGFAPSLQITGRTDLTFPYIPSHLHYILLELIKNAMRATMDKHRLEDDVPPVMVIIADGTENEDVVIKVADQGGGIKRSNMDKIWSYLFTTVDATKQEAFFHSDHTLDSPLAGLGYGLPISRSHARYFGGDLDVLSMEGYGTDAFVYLKRLGNSPEPLPT